MASAKNLTSINEINTLRRWVRIACDTQGIGVEWTNNQIPYTSKKQIFIPQFNSNMTHNDVKRIRFYVLHELSHHNNGSHAFFDVMEKNGVTMKHPIGAISNIVEDQRIERLSASKYEGDAQIISDGRVLLCEESVKHWKDLTKRLKPDDLDDEAARMQAIYGAAGVSQSGWCAGINGYVRREMDLTCGHFPNIKSNLEKLIGNNVISKINSLPSPEGSYNLAVDIYKLLWNKTDEEIEQELEKLRQQQKGKGDGKQGNKDDGDSGSDAQDTQTTNNGDDNGEPIQGSGVDPRTGKYKIPLDYFVKSDHGQMKDGEHGHGLGLDYTDYRAKSHYEPEDFTKMDVRDFTKTEPNSRASNITDWANISNEDLSASPSFANRVRTYLQVKTEDGYIGGMKKGSVNTRSLYRAGMPQIGDGDWNKKVFRVYDKNDMLDTSVSLVVDMSGSMSGIKIVHATRAAMVLNHVISNVLRVNTEILTFSWDHRSIIGAIKPFGTKVSDEAILARFNTMADKMWGNDDADAISYAYNRLCQQHTKRKVMIVLSDGSPADGVGDSDPYYALGYVVDQIELEKKCDIIGIGIMDDSVKHFYERRIVIPDSNQLEEKLLEVITGNIIGGN